GEDPDLPTAESLTQHPTKFGVGSAGPLGIAQAATVGGVRKHEAARRASGLQHVGLPLLWAEARRAQLREHELLNPQVLAHPRALWTAEGLRSNPRMGAASSPRIAAFAAARSLSQASLSKQGHCSNAKERSSPGARWSAIAAASIGRVPAPHIGSTRGVVGSHPQSKISAAARVSRKGAW